MKVDDIVFLADRIQCTDETVYGSVQVFGRYGRAVNELDALVVVDIPWGVMWADVGGYFVSSLHGAWCLIRVRASQRR